jgi:peptide/nickel transport system permease protein
MIRHILRTLLFGLGVVLTAVIGTFLLIRLAGSPEYFLLPPDATEDQREQVRAALGLNEPLIVQFGKYLLGLLRGDMGRSYFDNAPVADIIGRHAEATFQLAAASFVLILVVSLGLGTLSALKRGRLLDRVTQVGSVFAASMPTFWVGILLIQVFALGLGILPSFGRTHPLAIVLPAVTLMLTVAPALTRVTRSSMVDVLNEPYVATARAKGMPESRVISRTVLRNGLSPVVALLALDLGNLLGGAVLTETVFSWPGIGWLVVQSVSRRDFPVVQGVVVYVAVIFVIVTLVAELLSQLIDPRRRGSLR